MTGDLDSLNKQETVKNVNLRLSGVMIGI
jgi:hypothetical protein